MRDIFFTLCLPFFLFFALRSPIVGLYLWFWTTMYPLQNWLYGFALSFRVNLLFALATIFSYFFVLKNKPAFKVTVLFSLIILFFLHSFMGVSLHSVIDYQWEKFTNFSKTIVFFVFIVLILRKRQHFNGLLNFLVLALCFHGFMEGLKVLVSFGGHTVTGIIGPLGDNNKVALGLNMSIPFLLYLVEQSKEKILKIIYLMVGLFCLFTILGSRSRGGLIALVAMAVYYWWKSENKFLLLAVIFSLVLLFYNFLPPEWFHRIDKLENIEGTGVLTYRVMFWKINLLAALDHPFTGLGFDSTSMKIYWQQYAPYLNTLNWIIDTPYPTQGFVAHSIYFQVLGNQGFIGFILFVLMLITSFLNLGNQQKYFKNDSWQFGLSKACKISLATLCIGGAALNAAYFELLYVIFGIIICLNIIKNNKESKSIDISH